MRRWYRLLVLKAGYDSAGRLSLIQFLMGIHDSLTLPRPRQSSSLLKKLTLIPGMSGVSSTSLSVFHRHVLSSGNLSERRVESGKLKLGDKKHAIQEMSNTRCPRRTAENFQAEQAALTVRKSRKNSSKHNSTIQRPKPSQDSTRNSRRNLTISSGGRGRWGG